MLRSLFIKNYALIDILEINFKSGLNIITGETGAGKSIMLGALGLVMGNRADSKALLDTKSKCIIEVKFTTDDFDLKPFFKENDLDFEDELIIRREITPSGKSRAFVNDSPCTLDILKGLTSMIIDIHQQFDTQDIQDPKNQISLIDTLAENTEIKRDYQSLYEQHKNLKKELEHLKEVSKQAQKDLDYMSFQLNELESIELDNLDQEEMESELNILERAEEVKEVFNSIAYHLDESETSILENLNNLTGSLQSIATLSPQYEEVYTRTLSALEELRDISNESQRLSDGISSDEERMTYLQETLNTLYNLQTKHQISDVNGLIQLKNDLSTKVNQFTNIESELNTIENAIKDNFKNLNQKGIELRSSRFAVVGEFKSQVELQLSQLAMANAKIEVQFTEKSEPGPNGLDHLEFMFSANKGSSLQPLKAVASGGETSRLALCIKSVVAQKSQLPTMIFDEIDTGVSGEVAQKMGNILLNLAKNHQVLTITHSPQIAAKAKQHFYVYKEETAQATISKIRELDEQGKIHEVAKMISGDPPSQIAIKAAADLIEN